MEQVKGPDGSESELRDPLEIPALAPGCMAASKPYVAAPEFQKALGFPGELVENWQDKAIEKMAELRGKYRSFRVFLNSCIKCGACTDKCHYFLGTGDPKNMPVARQDLLRQVYRRHFTLAGKYVPWLVGATRPHRTGSGRLVQLFPPVLGVPPLLRLLPDRYRHCGNYHCRTRNHGFDRQGTEVLQ